ncbi:MAG: Rhs family protein [Gammaproteobacteria bacterium]|nr:Rhs family protein [Gammaproteobacteria bacterium]
MGGTSYTAEERRSQDPLRLRAGVNFYTYALGNPLSLDDPLGLWAIYVGGLGSIFGGGLSAGAGGGFIVDSSGNTTVTQFYNLNNLIPDIPGLLGLHANPCQ